MMKRTNSALFIPVAILILAITEFAAAQVIYVDDTATGANNGSSWTNAHINLQDALDQAQYSSSPVEIRVAQGIYKPDRGYSQQPGDRNSTFSLINNTTILGGFAGSGAADPDVRNISLYKTILSGDLKNNDTSLANPSDMTGNIARADNCYHVVTASATNATAILDGFTITAGQDDQQECFEEGPELICMCMAHGAGIYNDGGSPTIRNCTIEWNSAFREDLHTGEAYGGGMYNINNANPTMTNCTFTSNWADEGGGMYNNNSAPILIDCTFNQNASDFHGAAINNNQSDPMLTNCIITENSAPIGGAIVNMWSHPTLIECTLSYNTASNKAGAIYNEEGVLTLIDCLLTGNTGNKGGAVNIYTGFGTTEAIFQGCKFIENTSQTGGAIYVDASRNSTTLELSNCILAGNSVTDKGGALYTYAWIGQASVDLNSCTFNGNLANQGGALYTRQTASGQGVVEMNVTNCILWGDGPTEIYNEGIPSVTVTRCDVQGDFPGQFNINTDPFFVDPVSKDWHLKSQAGRWNPDSQSWIQDDITSPCIDNGDPMLPIGSEPFPNGGIANIGAYGGTTQASKSYFGSPVCETVITGDINGDCKVDFKDFSILSLHWLQD